ncbi:MAG: hypothetical protein J6I68_11525 [Butyrivibrio sp.]|uniref:hypothetical protein n=1 Tax=Butyrivibrio sp. TaxID=28121 RepID=UPI001B6CB93C|nr:hypothetical protein [Butyrivibrio sp.]MBP3783866.1 hypothetical protein [Butyrivibrio sp.]
MNDIKQLLTEYSEVTGRPLATISISEYLEIKRYLDAGAHAPITTQLETKEIPQETKTVDIKPQIKPASEPAEIKAVKKDTLSEHTDKKPISSAFMMMRSIGG